MAKVIRAIGGHVLQIGGTGVPPVAPSASRRHEIATFIQSTHEGGDSGQATIPLFHRRRLGEGPGQAQPEPLHRNASIVYNNAAE